MRVVANHCLVVAVLMLTGALASAADVATKPAPAVVQFTSAATGNIFAADKGSVDIVLADDARGGGSVVVSDERGVPITTVKVPANVERVSLPLPRKGFYKLNADIVKVDGTHVAAFSTAAVIGPALPEAARLASPLGIESVAGPQALGVLAGAGFDRGFTPQNGIGQKGTNDVGWWPGYNAKPPKEPINIINAIMTPPGWVVAPENKAKQNIGTSYPPVDWENYRKVVRLFATSQSWVKGFEGLNEPDAYHWKGTDADLVQYHKVIREELIAAGLGQKLYGPCFWSVDMQHIDKLVKLGLLDAVDGISIHSYANAPPEGKWIGEIRDLKTYLAKAGHPNEPIHLTEYGWDIGNGDKTTPEKELQQARYASRGIALLAREHLASAIYFALRWTDGVTGPNWSILWPDNTPRPGYAAIATSYRWLTGCKGGTLIHPTPTSYLILFASGTRTVGVAWDTDDSSRFQLPYAVTRVEGMTGAPITPDSTGHITLTQSPTYFDCADGRLASPTAAKPVKLVRGGLMPVPPYDGLALPGPLSWTQGAIAAPADAQPGAYTALVKAPSGWQTLPIQIEPLWSITSAKVVWPLSSPVPAVQLTVHTIAPSATLNPLLRLSGRPDEFGAAITVRSGKDTQILIPIRNYAPGTPISGEAVLEGRTAGKLDSTSLRFRAQPIPCRILPAGQAAQWDDPAALSNLWRGFGGAGPEDVQPADCSAAVRACAAPDGLRLRVVIRDDVAYSGATGDPLWATDSIQVAFDVAEAGSRSPRSVEYSIAGRDGAGLVARDRSTIAELLADGPEPRIKAVVTRDGDTTRYDVTFPWATLGLTRTPATGTTIGFDIAVNDSDGKGKPRHGIEMTDGIVATKDTSSFASLLFR
ncbi:MAG TPA: sugar-binding protein [Capsulimonadaceae bacterium]|jgi:hypothetical protein